MKKEVYCLKRFERVVPADNTRLPGMHTLMGDLSDRARVNYFPNIEYICRDGQPLCLQLLLPYNMFPDGCGSGRSGLTASGSGSTGRGFFAVTWTGASPRVGIGGSVGCFASGISGR